MSVSDPAARLGRGISPEPSKPGVSVDFGAVEAVNADGSLDVSVRGGMLRGIRAAGDATVAKEGDRIVITTKGRLSVANGIVGGFIAKQELDELEALLGISGGGCSMTDLIWDMAHPVGSVLQVAGGFNPNDVRGEWERLEGVFLLASSGDHPAGETGGQANHRHAYAVKTTHYYGGLTTSDTDPDDGFALWDFEQGTWVLGNIDQLQSKRLLTINHALDGHMSKEYLGILNNTKARSGLGTAPSDGDDDNILPPYLAVDTWRRVA